MHLDIHRLVPAVLLGLLFSGPAQAAGEKETPLRATVLARKAPFRDDVATVLVKTLEDNLRMAKGSEVILRIGKGTELRKVGLLGDAAATVKDLADGAEVEFLAPEVMKSEPPQVAPRVVRILKAAR